MVDVLDSDQSGIRLVRRARELLATRGEAETQESFGAALSEALGELEPAASELALRVRALELRHAPGVSSLGEARTLAQLEAELVPEIVNREERASVDDVERAAQTIARGRGTTLAAIDDEDELADLYSQAEAELRVDGRLP